MDQTQLEQLKNKLPKTPGINSKEEFINSAVLVLLMLIDGEYHLVFQKRNADIRQGGEICFPGGIFDAQMDDSYAHTAIRETTEELGIPADKISLLGPVDTVMSPMGITVDGFVALAHLDSIEQMKINNEEVESVFTIPVSYFENNPPQRYEVQFKIHPSYIDKKTGQEINLLPAVELGLPIKYHQPWSGSKFKILLYQHEKATIWGLTARFIYDLVNKLKVK